ncbi:MAG TPA: 6-phosphogluconolactonase [Rhodothermales bacterium]|nr:6-phosphogluconolactonase [Rhodothermales bacterium]
MRGEIHVYRDLEEVCRRAATLTVALVQDVVTRNGRCSLALAGGSTPRMLYGLLAADYAGEIPWQHIHLFWGDERYVPYGDSSSNYGMVRERLLRHVPIRPGNVHPMPTSFTEPQAAADAYESMLREYFAASRPRFDLVLLGIGSDGHTASLFPGSPAAEEQARWVMAADVAADPPRRLTLTFPAINAAANVFVLAAGAAKAKAVQCALRETPDLQECPASGIRPESGNLMWWLDEEAAEPV